MTSGRSAQPGEPEFPMSRRSGGLALLFVVTVVVTACAPIDSRASPPAGFWTGVADGFLIVFEFLGGRLNGPYGPFNAGWPYGLGYLLGAAGFMGAGRLAASAS